MKRSASLVALSLALASTAGAGLSSCAAEGDASPPPNEAPDASQAIPEVEAGSDGGDGEAAIPTCTATFCAVAAPIPPLVALNAVWGASSTDIWTVGAHGTVLHGDGTTFTKVTSGSDEMLFSIWGSASDDVWIAAATAPLHIAGFQGASAAIARVEGATYQPDLALMGRIWTVWGSAADRVWLVGESSGRFGEEASLWAMAEADGGVSWEPKPACSPGNPCGAAQRAIWAPRSNGDNPEPGTPDIGTWIVGADGKTSTFEGGDGGAPAWTIRDSRTRGVLEAVWGSSASDVWAVGQDGTIRHYANDASKKWEIVESPTGSALHAVWGSGASDVWAAGDDGVVLHWNGTTWSHASIGGGSSARPHLYGIWGSGPNDVWIVGEGIVLHKRSTP